MNLETILSYTYYIQIHKLTTIEHLNPIILNWHRTLKYPAQDLSPSQLIGIYPRVIRHTKFIHINAGIESLTIPSILPWVITYHSALSKLNGQYSLAK
jgi:hypothetical protein